MNPEHDVMVRPPKILLTRIGLDAHDRGSRLVAVYLRDAGMEVVYTGPWMSLRSVVNLALQEDVDVVGISSLATDHVLVPRLMDDLRAAGLGHVSVVVGGIVPDADVGVLTAAGVSRVFHPGATRDEIVAGVAACAAATRARATKHA